jgi:HTH-type transcriptional regulator/antitoxin HigA
MPQLDPTEAIKYKMEKNDLTQKDLVKYFTTKSRVSEVLNRKKPLTLKMIKALYKNFRIPAETLLAH